MITCHPDKANGILLKPCSHHVPHLKTWFHVQFIACNALNFAAVIAGFPSRWKARNYCTWNHGIISYHIIWSELNWAGLDSGPSPVQLWVQFSNSGNIIWNKVRWFGAVWTLLDNELRVCAWVGLDSRFWTISVSGLYWVLDRPEDKPEIEMVQNRPCNPTCVRVCVCVSVVPRSAEVQRPTT